MMTTALGYAEYESPERISNGHVIKTDVQIPEKSFGLNSYTIISTYIITAENPGQGW